MLLLFFDLLPDQTDEVIYTWYKCTIYQICETSEAMAETVNCHCMPASSVNCYPGLVRHIFHLVKSGNFFFQMLELMVD